MFTNRFEHTYSKSERGMSLSKLKRIHALYTARAKCLDFHPTKPLVLAALYSGEAIIVDTVNGNIAKKFPVHSPIPLRAGKWIPQTGDIVVAGDNKSIHFFSPTKGKATIEIKDAHDGYIRALAVHPTEPLLLSCSDDLTIKLWNISSGCTLVRTYKQHTGLVMDVQWNPKDTTTFASCSLDGTVIFWETSSERPRFTQKVSVKCINSISFSTAGDRPLLAAGCDDHSVQIWDLQARSLVHRLDGHEGNVTRVCFLASRPFLVSTGEDSSTILWSSSTFKKENGFSSALERGWALAFSPSLPLMAIGHDKGITVHKFKNLGVPMSLDGAGKLVLARGSEVQTAAIKGLPEFIDGAEIPLAFKEGVTAEVAPTALRHSPNGRFVATVSEGEWTVYTALGFRSRAYGPGISFAWASNSSSFATLNPNRSVEVHSSFDEAAHLEVFAPKLWGGELIGVLAHDELEFYDWQELRLVRRIEIKPRDVQWYGNLVAVRSKEQLVVLAYNPEPEAEYEEGEGFEDAFEVVASVDARASSMCWAAGELVFTEGNKISRIAGGVVLPTAALKAPCELVGYVAREGVLLLADQQRNVVGANLPADLIEFEVAAANDEDCDPEMVPEQYRTRTAKFLRQLGKPELALEVATDASMRFDLALELGDLSAARENAADAAMWRRLARAALTAGEIELACEACRACGDLSTLLALLKARGDRDGLAQLADDADAQGQLNVAFTAALLAGQKERCIGLLQRSGRFPEAALFARSHVPSMAGEAVRAWKAAAPNARVADALADPDEFPNLFAEIDQ